jgi:uncharacterized SAM-binding protein YcdF (DUF218 family)
MDEVTSRRLLVVFFVLAMIGVCGRYGGSSLVVERPLESPDLIVSLASHEWERLPEAARLATRYSTSRLVLTLPAAISELNCHDCSHRVARLVRMGIDARRITIVPLVESGTYGEALAVHRFAGAEFGRKLLIVTSPYHTRRALATFRAVFRDSSAEIGVAPAPDSPADPRHWWRTPYDRWYVRYEWLATVYYALRYGVLPEVNEARHEPGRS